MTRDVTTHSPYASLREAMALLDERRISGAPVVSGEALVGVVSKSDLIGFAAKYDDRTMAAALAKHSVADVMSTDLVMLRSDVPVRTAADVMRTQRIHRVFIVDDGELVGVVTTLDVANAVANGSLNTRTYLFNHHPEFSAGW
jgi:CBS domain-containing protein